jgi:hypothetical protein
MSNFIHDILILFGCPPKRPSLLALQVRWLNSAGWMQRLEANKQITEWISVKHHRHEDKNETQTGNKK